MRRPLQLPIVFGFVALLLAMVSAASAPVPAPTLPVVAGDYVPGELIVRFKDTALTDPRPNLAIQRLAPLAVQRLSAPGLARVVLPVGEDVSRAVSRYQADPAVLYAQPNFRYRAQRLPNDARFNQLWALQNAGQNVTAGRYTANNPGAAGNDMDLPAAWELVHDCRQIVVAVLDSGVNYTHEDLAANMWDGSALGLPHHGYDFFDNDADPMPADGDGHGTHVAGAIAAHGDNAVGTTGLCWRARLMALRVLDASGGTTATVVRALRFAVDQGARVINLSLGGSGYDPAFEAELVYAAQRDVVVVAAAGNDGHDLDGEARFYPCSFKFDNLLCVAALDQSYALASFSNYGSRSVHLAAPGTNTLSTWPGLTTQEDFVGGWNTSASGWRATQCGFGAALVNPAHWCVGGGYGVNADDRVTKTFDFAGLRGAGAALWYFLLTADGGDRLSIAYDANGDAFGIGSIRQPLTTVAPNPVGGHALGLRDCLSATCQIGFQFVSDGAGTDRGPAVFGMTVHRAETGSTYYEVADGTSMATPHVSGIAALVWSYNPNYTARDVVNAVKNGGDAIPLLQSYTTTGRAADAWGALRYLHAPDGVRASRR